MKRLYELTIIFVNDDDFSENCQLLRCMLAGLSCVVKKWEDDGVKRLAYTIRTHGEGHYLYLEPEILEDGDRDLLVSYLNKNEAVLRFLLVPKDDR